jgi:hypothetical protein
MVACHLYLEQIAELGLGVVAGAVVLVVAAFPVLEMKLSAVNPKSPEGSFLKLPQAQTQAYARVGWVGANKAKSNSR